MTLTKYSGQYEELFTGCAAYYDGSYSGTTLYNIINPAQNGTLGAHASIVADRNGLIKAIQTNPTSTSDSTAVVTCYPQSGSLYTACFWANVRTINASGESYGIRLNTSPVIMLSVGDYSGSVNPVIGILRPYHTKHSTFTTDPLGIGWHHIIYYWNGSKYDIYIDGVFVSTSTETSNVPLAAISSSHGIGCWATISYIQSNLSEYMVFTSQPTVEQMIAIYKLQRNKYLYPVQSGARGVE